ncbi:Crp/Fnr family transcriptional regulator [Nitrosococcus wardiae]|uniref:Crp/Fnr family transcriptional regulator n=1 Tax=Nitrosococcus wardiae TaxID=1814290 RepID=A0A4P7BW11_9GAMM|nr:Crp/Fnr family transcriptional regulator [Nitrosococcus wardiae]QBQ54233.1 Crp/Fnr family transcriptional regulator [Nitrosococcus wardiae]
MVTIERWKAACPSLTLLNFRHNALIYRQGDLCTHLFYIAKGYIKLSKVTPDGEQFIVILLPAGELLSSSFSNNARELFQETATAKGRVQLYRFSREEFMASLSAYPDLARYVIERLSNRQLFLERRLEYLLYKNVHARMAALLYELAKRYGGNAPMAMKWM